MRHRATDRYLTCENMPKVIIAAAGTGGHVFPGVAVAQALLNQGVDVAWVGTVNGKESAWVDKAGLPFFAIDMQGVRSKGWLAWLGLPVRLFKAFVGARNILKDQQATLLLVMGGYVSLPVALAAKSLGVPVWLHEQNSVAGLSNRLVGLLAERLFLGLPLVRVPWGWRFAELIGNPLRQQLSRSTLARHESGRLRVLVLGGSQGAAFINDAMPVVVQDLQLIDCLDVWHQTGVRSVDKVREAYRAISVHAQVDAFIDDMAQAYDWADVVVARAGALTVSELLQTARVSLLIPFPHAVDDHQRYNAEFVVRTGGASLFLQSTFKTEQMQQQLRAYCHDALALDAAYRRLCQQPENTAAQTLADRIVQRIGLSSEGCA